MTSRISDSAQHARPSGALIADRALSTAPAPVQADTSSGFAIRTPSAMACFALSVAALAFPIIGNRLFNSPRVYSTVNDVLLHVSAEVLTGLTLGSIIWLPFYVTACIERAWPNRATLIRAAVLLVPSLAASLAVYVLVIRPSTYLGLFGARVWLTLIAIPCTASVLALHAGVRRAVKVAPTVLAAGLIACACAAALLAQDRFMRLNVVLHAASLLIASILASIAGGIVAARLNSVSRRALVVAVTLAATATLTLYFCPASNAARRAVLQQGGLARHAVTLLVWRWADGDGDGIPSRAWGNDPNDSDHRVTPLTSTSRAATARHQKGNAHESSTLPNRPSASLLWIVLDSVRLDTFNQIIRLNPRLKKTFTEFTLFENYSSCSSRTDQALEGLLGDRSCPRDLHPEKQVSFISLLHSLGYTSASVGSYAEFPLQATERTQSDEEAIEKFNELISRSQSDDSRLLLLHLRGGHAPYEDRQAYESAIESDLLASARIVENDLFRDWVVVVMGDHGEAFGEHESAFHSITLYEELLRTPFLIRSKRHAPGADSTPAGCSDMIHQVLFGLGVSQRNPGFSGLKFATLDLSAGPLGQLTPLSLRSLRIGNTKIIWEPRLDVYELYDLATDPGELNDIADDAPERLAAAKRALRSAVADCNASDLWISH